MRRADRLFQRVQLICGRRLCTAALLADRAASTARLSTLLARAERFRDEPGRSLANLVRRYAVAPPRLGAAADTAAAGLATRKCHHGSACVSDSTLPLRAGV